MTIKEIIKEFRELYKITSSIKFDNAQYLKCKDDITEYVYKNHFDNTDEWQIIKKNLINTSYQYLSSQEANNIIVQLENFKRMELAEENECIWKYIHNDILKISKDKILSRNYADAVESAFKEINTRLKNIYFQIKKEEKDGSSLAHLIFSPKNPVLIISDITSSSGSSEQQGYMEIFSGSMTAIRNPKAHANLNITREEALQKLVLASILMNKIDQAVANTKITETVKM